MEMLTLMMTNNGQRIHQVSFMSLRMIIFIFGKLLITKNIQEMGCFIFADGSRTSRIYFCCNHYQQHFQMSKNVYFLSR